MTTEYGDLLELLTEWFRWWEDDPDAPAKLPDALQVRTAMALQTRGIHVIAGLADG